MAVNILFLHQFNISYLFKTKKERRRIKSHLDSGRKKKVVVYTLWFT